MAYYINSGKADREWSSHTLEENTYCICSTIHQEEDIMMEREALKPLRTYVYWPNMQREFIEYCQRCIKCQYYNKRCRKPGPYPRDIPQKPWEKCSADIVGPLIKSARGYRYILVMQDQLTQDNQTSQSEKAYSR